MARRVSEHTEDLENPAYLTDQLITCIGNKRALLGPIGKAMERVKTRLGKKKLRCFDAFSGSGVVSRFLKAHSERLVSNDLEAYAATLARCYLQPVGDAETLRGIINRCNREVDAGQLRAGFIADLYSPKSESRIQKTDRVFYTTDNAKRLDTFCQMIDDAPSCYRDCLLGPLLSKGSIHANTAGVFKGFYKNHSGVGKYGGSGADALGRIRGTIRLEMPVASHFDCNVEVHQRDANELAQELTELDFVYIDPPYNQHPYGSNYFMLNLLVNYQRPMEISRVSGIPKNWTRSGYNVRSRSKVLLRSLLETIPASHLLISFNNEGFISPKTMHSILRGLGTVSVIEERYNTFRGSRNLRNRSIHVVEQLFLLEKS